MSNKSILIIALAVAAVVTFSSVLVKKNQSEVSVNRDVSYGSSNSEASQSLLEVDPSSFDLGTVVYGEVAEKTFKLRNTGSNPLEILKVSTSCGCTQASVQKENSIIAPGEETDMLVTFDPAVHKDDSDLGDIVRVVYIRTDDQSYPETEVTITANVIKN